MKKTLFALAALALCGTAFAEEYNIWDYQGQDLTLSNGDTLNLGVGGLPLSSFKAEGTCSFVYMENPYMLKAQSIDLTNATFNITSTIASASSWVGGTSNAGLVSFSGPMLMAAKDSITLDGTSFTLEGAGVGETFSLTCDFGVVTGTFIGEITSDTVLEDGQVGWKAVDFSLEKYQHTIVLRGRNLFSAPPTTPEPATATLSLMALAGLASRRRRH